MSSKLKPFLLLVCGLLSVAIFCGCAATGGSGSGSGDIPVNRGGGGGSGGGGSGGNMRGGGGPFALGIDVLEAEGFARLRGKRVGLVANQTSVNGRGVPSRMVLHRDSRVNLTALFAPEHGIEGTIPAGKYVSNRRDPLTGLTVYSLYGPTRKPTPAMLADVDVLLFDLQDIGSRSYTYISTMVKCMEACGETNTVFVVLDRPNPIGGQRINGPPLDRNWTSFVGQIPVPYIHGMTAGELALMTNAKRWAESRTRLDVVPMRGYRRDMVWSHTGLRWVPTSPNIPHPSSPFYYASTAVLGSMVGMDVGIGTNEPFALAGTQHIDADAFAAWCQQMGAEGVFFEPYRRPPWGGVRLRIHPRAPADLVAVDVAILAKLNQLRNGQLLANTTGDKRDIFFKVFGSDRIAHHASRGVTYRELVAEWSSFHNQFRRDRQPFLLYD